jgi:organic radical activating enzyme
MAFIRFVGCSVGKKICQHCDTVFEKMLPWQGGGEFTAEELRVWSHPCKHICLTGGEPLDQDLPNFISEFSRWPDPDGNGYAVEKPMFHIETSGTKDFRPAVSWLTDPYSASSPDVNTWICVSPKPGFLEEVVMAADEVKVIVPGLGELTEPVMKHLRDKYNKNTTFGVDSVELPINYDNDPQLRWPTINDALRWADAGKIVFLQPRNGTYDVDKHNLMIVQDIIRDYPQLRLSVQMHKILKVQ